MGFTLVRCNTYANEESPGKGASFAFGNYIQNGRTYLEAGIFDNKSRISSSFSFNCLS